MYWHIDADIISLIVMAAVYVCSRSQPPEAGSSLRARRFTRCLETGIGIAAIDIAASVVMEIPAPRPLYHLLMTAYFVCIELVIVEWSLYVLTILFPGREKTGAAVARAVLLTYGAYVLFSFANPWTGLIYRLGPSNEYSRGPLFCVTLALFASYTAALFVLILIRWKQIPAEFPGGVLLLTPVIIASAIVVQLSVPGWLFIVPAYMVCLVLAFLFLQSMQVRNSQKLVADLERVAETDRLTGLYNRVGMEVMVHRTLEQFSGQNVVVLIADIDDLKTINDTMGHAEGDRSIRLAAAQLKRHFRATDTVVRYGGDEFLAFFAGEFTESQMRASLRQLVQELGQLRIGPQNDVPLHGSIGAALGVVGRESFETLCSRADTALYHVKRSGKNGYALYQPGMENYREFD